jgi:formylmethanofuran dehydrogenase subunit E
MMKDNPLLVAAGRFHGHIGPFLAVGLRMGLLANETLGRDPMDVRVTVRVEGRPPRSCVIDGIQYSAGCTMGKRNIALDTDPKAVSARFTRGSQTVDVRLRDDFLIRIEKDLEGADEKAIVDYSFRIMDTAPGEMFEVSE